MPRTKLDCVVFALVLGLVFSVGWLYGSRCGLGSAQAGAPAPAGVVVECCDRLEVIEVIDGDTIRANVLLGRAVVLRAQSIRLAGFDAWEVSRRRRTVEVTDEEIARGRAASKALAELLDGARAIVLTDGDRDPYGRLLGRLRVVDAEGRLVRVERFMRAAGHHRGELTSDQG